jgi:hypothetical protein
MRCSNAVVESQRHAPKHALLFRGGGECVLGHRADRVLVHPALFRLIGANRQGDRPFIPRFKAGLSGPCSVSLLQRSLPWKRG